MMKKSGTPEKILQTLLVEDGITPSPGLVPEELVRLSLDALKMPEELEYALGAAFAGTVEKLEKSAREQ